MTDHDWEPPRRAVPPVLGWYDEDGDPLLQPHPFLESLGEGSTAGDREAAVEEPVVTHVQDPEGDVEVSVSF